MQNLLVIPYLLARLTTLALKCERRQESLLSLFLFLIVLKSPSQCNEAKVKENTHIEKYFEYLENETLKQWHL